MPSGTTPTGTGTPGGGSPDQPLLSSNGGAAASTPTQAGAAGSAYPSAGALSLLLPTALAAVEGQQLSASGEISDPGGKSWSGQVTYGDGSAPQALSIAGRTFALTHKYADEGTYRAAVSVTDDAGRSQTATVSVNAGNYQLALNMPADLAFSRGSLLFQAGGSFVDPGSDTWTATVDYGDGTGQLPLALSAHGFQLLHAYVTDGVHLLTVTVTDDDGYSGHAVTRVTVTP